MRDEQVRRYARHILLPDVGGLGQTALLVAAARVAIDGEPSAALVAATYLAAGGVGAIVVAGASEAQRAQLAAHGPDTKVVTPEDHADAAEPTARTLALRHPREVAVPPPPPWWPASAGDATALAHWRGGVAATAWMAAVIDR